GYDKERNLAIVGYHHYKKSLSPSARQATIPEDTIPMNAGHYHQIFLSNLDIYSANRIAILNIAES
ncbi:MAG: hypothetical protein FWG20_05585, partial [Candidatus Cloacimonetes bacterium]|nr:hypothetical protein [Candidatus Cloacimonadota bacterium]